MNLWDDVCVMLQLLTHHAGYVRVGSFLGMKLEHVFLILSPLIIFSFALRIKPWTCICKLSISPFNDTPCLKFLEIEPQGIAKFSLECIFYFTYAYSVDWHCKWVSSLLGRGHWSQWRVWKSNERGVKTDFKSSGKIMVSLILKISEVE